MCRATQSSIGLARTSQGGIMQQSTLSGATSTGTTRTSTSPASMPCAPAASAQPRRTRGLVGGRGWSRARRASASPTWRSRVCARVLFCGLRASPSHRCGPTTCIASTWAATSTSTLRS
eukprot:3968810-Alexandrium_andersonii.AAC.2